MPHTTDPHGSLFEQLRPRLTAISRRIVGSEAEAEDIVQDCFLKWQAIDSETLATPAAWLTTVVQHQSIDTLRKRSREAIARQVATELLPDAPPGSPEEDLLRRAELSEALARLMTWLSPSERLALVLREGFDCEHADIAAALGTKPVNARQYLARARQRLREHQDVTPPDEKRCRELVRRFQAAINGLDVPAMVTLLADEQPVSVTTTPRMRIRSGACANDAMYALAA